LFQTIQKRGAAVIAARKLSSAMSAAKAASDHMKDWWQGTGERWVSMGIISDGSYGVPADIMFSFPVTCANKSWTIVQVRQKYYFAVVTCFFNSCIVLIPGSQC
jgi:malate dehydrogenase